MARGAVDNNIQEKVQMNHFIVLHSSSIKQDKHRRRNFFTMSLLKVNSTKIKSERQKYVIPKESSDTMRVEESFFHPVL